MRPRSAAKKPFICVSVEYCFGSYYDLSTWLEARLSCLSSGSCKAVFLVIRASHFFLHIFLPNFIILGPYDQMHVINNGRLYGVFWGKFFCTFFCLISSSLGTVRSIACYKQWAIVRCILGEVFLHIFLPNFIILGSACYKQWAIVRCILGEES